MSWLKMYVLLVLTAFLGLRAVGAEDFETKHTKSVNECGKELNMDSTAFLPDENRSITASLDPLKVSCMKKCIWEKLGYINAKAAFQEEAYHHDHPEMPPTHIHIFKTCSRLYAKNSTASCDTFRELQNCIITELGILYGRQTM